MRLLRCHHHGFTVSDIDRSLHFYRDILGFMLIQDALREKLPSYDAFLGYQDVKLRVAILQDSGRTMLLELVEYRQPPGQRREMQNYFVGASHVSFEVPDIDDCARSLKTEGVRIISDGPVDIVRDGRRVARTMYALDPDDITVELFEQIGSEIDDALQQEQKTDT